MQLYDFIESEDCEKVYEYVNVINATPEFFEEVDKYELLELSYCAWMLLDVMGMYSDFDKSFCPNLSKVFDNAYFCYQKNFADDNDITCVMGYMIRMFPYNFPIEGDDFSVIAFGNSLMEKAYQNEPNNPFIYLLNFRNSKGIGDKKSILRARSYALTKFKDCKGLTDYFQEILR